MGWWVVYSGLLAALVVRVQSSDAPARALPAARPTEPLRLVGFHHAIFLGLLVVVSPGEALLTGGVADGRWLGVLLFGLGIMLYRVAGRALGDALSPFVEPNPEGSLVTRGTYGVVRHPMYLGQASIAIGAPLTLGCRWALVGSAVALGTLAVRIRLEEAASVAAIRNTHGMQRARNGSSPISSSAPSTRRRHVATWVVLVWAAVVYVAYWLRYLPAGP